MEPLRNKLLAVAQSISSIFVSGPSSSVKIKPTVLLYETLDHPSDRCSNTLTLVPNTSPFPILPAVVDGPVLKLAPAGVPIRIMPTTPPEPPVALSKSDLINPEVPLCLTLDHPLDKVSTTSTLVPASSSLRMLDEVDARALRLTEPTVLSVAPACPEEPVALSKSDLINPVVPECLTRDHPSAWFSSTSTLVFAASVVRMFAEDEVDVLDLRLTVPMVLSVAIASPDGAASVDVPAEEECVTPAERVRKSDLIKPVVPECLTRDHPAGLCSSTSTLVPERTVSSIRASVDPDALMLTPSVVVNVAGVLPMGNLRKSDLIKPV